MSTHLASAANEERSGTTERQLVLIVEDNPTNARLTADMLRAVGYCTDVASEGSLGLRMARELQPALILVDLQMPDLDGLMLTRLLKADPLTTSIPVVAVTAHAMPEHREEALQAGCAAFISKPVRFREFVAEITNVVRSGRPHE